MHDPLSPPAIKPALLRIAAVAAAAAIELDSAAMVERRRTDVSSIVALLDDIRCAVNNGIGDDCDMVLQRLGLIDDPEPPTRFGLHQSAKNHADRIRDWIWGTLTALTKEVRQLESLDSRLMSRLLSRRLTDMLEAFIVIQLALRVVDRPALLVPIGPFPIPPGFIRCTECGEFRGTTRTRYLNWNHEIPPELDSIRDMTIYRQYEDERLRDPERAVTVTCLCEGITCCWCRVNKIRRPRTQKYYHDTNRITYLPWWSYLARCAACAAVIAER
jgi:hypothetical protein